MKHMLIFLIIIVISIIFIFKNKNEHFGLTHKKVNCYVPVKPAFASEGWAVGRPKVTNSYGLPVFNGYSLLTQNKLVGHRGEQCAQAWDKYLLNIRVARINKGLPANKALDAWAANRAARGLAMYPPPAGINTIYSLLDKHDKLHVRIGAEQTKDRDDCKKSIDRDNQRDLEAVCDTTRFTHCCAHGSCYDTCKHNKNLKKWGQIYDKHCCVDPILNKASGSPNAEYGWGLQGCRTGWRAPDSAINRNSCTNKI